MTGTQCACSGLAWSVRSSAEVSVHVSSHFFALNDRRDRQTELRIAAPWKSTTSIKRQKKEERLHSKRSPCKNRDGKIFATKCRQKHVCGGIALLAMCVRCDLFWGTVALSGTPALGAMLLLSNEHSYLSRGLSLGSTGELCQTLWC